MPPIDFRAHIRVPTDATGPVVAGLGAAEAADERMRTPPATEWLPPCRYICGPAVVATRRDPNLFSAYGVSTSGQFFFHCL